MVRTRAPGGPEHNSLLLSFIFWGPVFAVAALAALLASHPKIGEPAISVCYRDVTRNAGITFTQDATATEQKYYLETMGTGVAWIDYDQDGLLDLYLVQSAATDIYEPPRSLKSTLYHNEGGGKFTDVTDKAAVGAPGLYGQGAAVGDYDNDGYPDLYVTGYGRAVLFHNDGNNTFKDVTTEAGVGNSGQWSTSAGWFDYDRDGWLDLLVCNYIHWTPENNIWCGERRPGYRAYCPPDQYAGQRLSLYRNNQDGTFTDVSEESGVGVPEAKAMGVVLADFTGDHWTDIAIANDGWPNFFFVNNQDGTFEDRSFRSGLAASGDGEYEAGMGIDAADVNGDGWLEIYITHLDMEYHRLYQNHEGKFFEDVTHTSGLGSREAYLLSGVAVRLFDYDNDGWTDICQLNGAMLNNISLYRPGILYRQPWLMFRNMGAGEFTDVSEKLGADFTHPVAGRGLAAGDFDNDGDIDLISNNRGGRPSLLRNDGGNGNHWLGVKLIGTKSNRDAVGASLKITAGRFVQIKQVKGGMGYMSAHDSRVYVGLGGRKRVDEIEITWPSGRIDKLPDIGGDHVITVREGEGVVKRQ